jgi:hypothetical protein
MSLKRSRYKELGLKLIKPGENFPHQSKRPPIIDEKKDDGAGDPMELLLQEALERHMSEIKDQFSQIL